MTNQTTPITAADVSYHDQQRVAHLDAAGFALEDEDISVTERLIANAAHLRAAAAHAIAMANRDRDDADAAWLLTMDAAEIDGEV